MSNITIASNLTSAIFLIIILIGSYRVTKEVSQKIRFYRSVVWVCLAGALVDAASYYFDGRPNLIPLVGVTTYIAYIAIDLMATCYAFYLYTLIKENDPKFTRRFPIFIACLCTADITFLTIGALTGNLFSFNETGQLVLGPWDDFSAIGIAVCLFFMMVLLIYKGKTLGFKNTLVLAFYLILPVITVSITLINPEIKLGYSGSAASLLVTYIFIQSELIAESNIRARIYDLMAKEDVLTGLQNRRAFEEHISSLPEQKDIALVFSDINGLKMVNDHVGHDAGDELIKKAANILKEFFGKEKIYRISGDEFVVVLEEVSEEEAATKMKAFGDTLKAHKQIASFGYAIGKSDSVLALLKQAEKMMYSAKEKYYKDTGKDRRLR